MLRGIDLWEGQEPAKASSISLLATPSSSSSEANPPSKRKQTEESGPPNETLELKRRKEDDSPAGNVYEEGGGNQEQTTITYLNKRQRKKLQALQGTHGSSRMLLEIQEGRNRVIRRMCKKVRLPLNHLHRVRIGNIDLVDLNLEGKPGLDSSSSSLFQPLTSAWQGEWREVEEIKVEQLWGMVGGREVVTQMQIAALAERLSRPDLPTSGEDDGGGGGDEAGNGDQQQQKMVLERLESWFTRHGLTSWLRARAPK